MTRGHGEIRFAARIAADSDQIWAVIRHFGDVAAWSPIAETSRIVAGIDATPGAERELRTTEGTSVRERLTLLDDGLRCLEYDMLSFPIPVSEQHNRIVVEDAGPGWSRVTFVAWFVPTEGTTIEDIAAINRDVFAGAAAGIGRLLDVKVRPTD
ncbi:SRPBCC family protein [Sphingomonas echinoides]|uniref:SRPBCC family protein n=1 Tax=Sphingomonas echinoides TaxID=59803 RepID=UPI00241332B6|nr:SRPBCC family protein [Sphingomonas echinoides]